jgi:hypothetical protein
MQPALMAEPPAHGKALQATRKSDSIFISSINAARRHTQSPSSPAPSSSKVNVCDTLFALKPALVV